LKQRHLRKHTYTMYSQHYIYTVYSRKFEHFSSYSLPSFINRIQDAQLLQWDRAAGCNSVARKWKTKTGRQYYTDIIGLSSTTVT